MDKLFEGKKFEKRNFGSKPSNSFQNNICSFTLVLLTLNLIDLDFDLVKTAKVIQGQHE